MNCIKAEVIQKYVDGEIPRAEAALIEEHISGCEKCAAAIIQQSHFTDRVIEAVNSLAPAGKEATPFVAPASRQKRPSATIRKAVYYISAACILLFILIIQLKKEPGNDHQISIIHIIGPEVDANKPVTKQEIIIYVIDENGSMTEYELN
jgi:predicted anti-sigma-YlaC factor YlaD